MIADVPSVGALLGKYLLCACICTCTCMYVPCDLLQLENTIWQQTDIT